MADPVPPSRSAEIGRVVDYHARTMHRRERYARSLGLLDWDTQPDPFRRYADAAVEPLERVAPDLPATLGVAFDDLADPAAVPARPGDRALLSQLLMDSLALSAWKEFRGNRWALRVNPSSGNLHPTEGYVLTPDGVYHYAPREHALELRFSFAPGEWAALTASLPRGALLFGFTSIHWREAWKYGERAYRYCQHDVGHAIAAVTHAAAALGWRARLLQGMGDDQLARLLCVHHQRGPEREHPDGLLVLFPGDAADDAAAPATFAVPPPLLARIEREAAPGAPNQLSPDHHPWPIIDDCAAAAGWPQGAHTGSWCPPAPPRVERRDVPARPLFRQRRSAVAMDGQTAIDRASFFRMLARVLPGAAPLSTLPWQPAVHLALFVHRVRDVPSGLYLLVRDDAQLGELRAAMRPEFRWSRPLGCPDDLPLWTLAIGACDVAARGISCDQDIAGDGAFAVGMIAGFRPRLERHGAWFYRCLHWETGVIGQQLYLEAEAAGVRATGIGCFFDPLVHELLGLSGDDWRSLYHFTVGGPVEDERLRTLDPYA